MKNGRVLVVLVFIGLIAAGFAGSAQAQPRMPLNDYTLNFSGASGGAIPNLQHVDEMQFLAGSILGFRDHDRSGGISTGDTFQDYLTLRFHTINNVSGNNITPLTYGTGPGRTHEMTVKAAFSGVQISDNQYIINAVQLAELYFDSGATFTGSDPTDLRTFQNGLRVESAPVGPPAAPSGGNNAGPTAPDGTVDLIVQLLDTLNTIVPGQFFELDASGQRFTLPLTTLGDLDANNDATPPQTPFGCLNGSDPRCNNPGGGYADVFASFGLSGTQAADGSIGSLLDNNGAFDFGFATRSDGSFNKETLAPGPPQVIPEPSTLLLLGTGLAAVGIWARRRKRI